MTLTFAEAPALIAAVAVVAAAILDVVEFEIPNTLSIVVAVMAAAWGLLHPGFVWWSHLAAPALMFAFGLLAFARGWLGGGDVKLMTALSAWTGLGGLASFFLATSICGGGLMLILFLVRRAWSAMRRPVPARLEVLGRDAPIPYAVAIAAGGLWWTALIALK